MEEALRALLWELEKPHSILNSDADWLCKLGQITQTPYDLVSSFAEWENERHLSSRAIVRGEINM